MGFNDLCNHLLLYRETDLKNVRVKYLGILSVFIRYRDVYNM